MLLAGALRSAAPVDREPYLVVFTDTPENPAYWEHAWAAEALGVPIVAARATSGSKAIG